jgi:hypothetical protein
MSAARTVIFVRGLRVVGEIATDRFKKPVDVASRVESRQESSEVESVGTEVMEHGAPVVVEQRLDVDELQDLFAVPDDPLAEVEASGAFQLEPAGAVEIVAGGGAENPRRFGLEGWRAVSRWCVNLDQHLAQFRPPMRADDNRLATFEVGRVRSETAHLAPQAISDQIG